MTAEKAPLPRLEIVYNPREIVSFLKKKGPTTVEDLIEGFGYDERTAQLIMLDLRWTLGLVSSGEDDYKLVSLEEVEGGMQRVRVTRVDHLTKEAESIVQNLGEERKLVYTSFPIFSSTSAEMFNKLCDVFRVKGWGLAQLRKMLDEESPELTEIMKKIKVETVGDLNPEEIRQLGREIGEFFKGVPHGGVKSP